MKSFIKREYFITAAIAIFGAVLFYFFHLPIPWMLGAFFSMLCAQIKWQPVLKYPPVLMKVALIIIGYMLGSSFSVSSLAQITANFPIMLATTILTILFSVFLGCIVAWMSGLDIRTGILGFMPGGLAQMIAMSEEIKNVNSSIVGAMQLIRVILIIFLVPFLVLHGILGDINQISLAPEIQEEAVAKTSWFNYLIIALTVVVFTFGAFRLRFPIPYMMGPLLALVTLSVIGVQAPRLPDLFLITAQFLFGTYMGLQMQIDELKKHGKKVLIYTITASSLLVLFSLGISWFITKWEILSFISAFLSIAPGGIDVMGITASEVNANIPAVISFQLFRVFFILLAVPPLLKVLLNGDNTKGFNKKQKLS